MAEEKPLIMRRKHYLFGTGVRSQLPAEQRKRGQAARSAITGGLQLEQLGVAPVLGEQLLMRSRRLHAAT